MYEFLDRLVTMALPRVRDFRGLNGKSFDGRGNYAMGLKEHIVFVEIDYDKTSPYGAWTSSSTPLRGPMRKRKRFLKGFQFPFMIEAKTRMAKTQPDQPQQEARKARAAFCCQARGAQGEDRRHVCGSLKSVSRRISSSRNCRATRRRRASIIVANCRAGPRAITARSGCRVSRCDQLCEFRPGPGHDQGELVRRTGNGDHRSRWRSSDAYPQRPDARHGEDYSPNSRQRTRVLDVLQAEGFIRGYMEVDYQGPARAEIELKYHEGRAGHPRSEAGFDPGRRVYASVKELKPHRKWA